MNRKFDHLVFGIVLGLIMPVVGMCFFYLIEYSHQTSLHGFFGYYGRFHYLVPAMSVSCYATNTPLFFLFVWREKNKSARGVLLATIVYTLWVIYEKFLA